MARTAQAAETASHAVAPQATRTESLKRRIVNSSAYGFCVFEAAQLPRVRQLLLTSAALATGDSTGDEQLRGTILLSEEGVNIRLSGTRHAVDAMKQALRDAHEDLANMEFKDSYSERLTLPRMLVKIKKEVISMGDPDVTPATNGLATHISPEDFKQWLDEDREMVVLDTRNDYEVRLGTFEKAVDLNIQSFRAFPAAVHDHLQHVPKDTVVVMFCTGGVRCEKAAYTLLNDGREAVYQLDGGILKYFERVGGAHYKGDCYVFDDRVALTPALEESDAVACFACRSPLTREDQKSVDYVVGLHCPYCRHGKPEIRSASS